MHLPYTCFAKCSPPVHHSQFRSSCHLIIREEQEAREDGPDSLNLALRVMNVQALSNIIMQRPIIGEAKQNFDKRARVANKKMCLFSIL